MVNRNRSDSKLTPRMSFLVFTVQNTDLQALVVSLKIVWGSSFFVHSERSEESKALVELLHFIQRDKRGWYAGVYEC